MTTVDASTELTTLERQYRAAVDAVAAGDAEAQSRLPELRRRLTEARRQSEDAAAIRADLEQADAARRAREAAEREADRQQILRSQFDDLLEKRNALFRKFEQHLATLLADYPVAKALGTELDSVSRQLGRTDGGLQQVGMLRDMVERARYALTAALLAIEPMAGPMFGPTSGLGTKPLASISEPQQPKGANQ